MAFSKKIILLAILIIGVACDDGDFESLDFQFTETVSSCGTYLLYKTNKNNTETLILTLTDSELGTTVGEKTYSVKNNIKLIYRVFDKAINNTYFCQSIPPTTPTIIRNLVADPGTKVIINTSEKDGKYEYKITLSNLLFEDDSRFYFETFDFGTFTK